MTAASSETSTDPLERALSERARLVELCVYALDRTGSNGVAERLAEGLDHVGVVALRPEGGVFDPSAHEAGGVVDTDDPAQDGVIAGTEVVGFADRERVLRVPVVALYRLRRDPSGR